MGERLWKVGLTCPKEDVLKRGIVILKEEEEEVVEGAEEEEEQGFSQASTMHLPSPKMEGEDYEE